MTREVQSLVLASLGVVILRISWGGAYLNYVKASMQPWLLVSGAILVILGLWAMVDALRGPDSEPGHREQGGLEQADPDEHGHGHGGPRIAWLLFLPVLTISLVTPPALGAYAASRDTTNAVSLNTSLAPLPQGNPVPLFLSDYVTRAVYENGLSLEGRTVELTGFILPESDGSWLLARLQITCCAADAFASKVRPVNVPADMAALPENTWVIITGTWAPGGGTDPSTAIPLVAVQSMRVVPQPENPYD